MEEISNNVLGSFLQKFSNNTSIKNVLIIDHNGNIIASSQKVMSQVEDILNFINKVGIFKINVKNYLPIKNLKQIIFDYLDNQIILSILQTENFILTFIEDKQNLLFTLNELNSLVEKVDEFFYSKNTFEKIHLVNLDENIKKLENYLDLMQPPKFKDIKKLIEYIS